MTKKPQIQPVQDLSPAMPMTRDCVTDIREIITRARQSVVRHVNSTMVLAYWLVGRRLVVEEQKGASRAAYGEHLIERVSREVSATFGNGFGIANLRNFSQFYLMNPSERQIRYALRSELSWTHFRALIRVGDPKERAYYLDFVRMSAALRDEADALHADEGGASVRDRTRPLAHQSSQASERQTPPRAERGSLVTRTTFYKNWSRPFSSMGSGTPSKLG